MYNIAYACVSECVLYALCTVYNRCDTCHSDGYRRWSPRRMRLVRHGRRTQRRAGPQTRWSRGYTAWHGSVGRSVGRLSVCRRRTAISIALSPPLTVSLSLSLSLSIHRSIYPSLFIFREQVYNIYIYIYTHVYLYRFLSPSLSPVPIVYTHTYACTWVFEQRSIYIIILCIYDLTNLSSHTHIIYDRNLGASRKEKRIYTRKKKKKK